MGAEPFCRVDARPSHFPCSYVTGWIFFFSFNMDFIISECLLPDKRSGVVVAMKEGKGDHRLQYSLTASV